MQINVTGRTNAEEYRFDACNALDSSRLAVVPMLQIKNKSNKVEWQQIL